MSEDKYYRLYCFITTWCTIIWKEVNRSATWFRRQALALALGCLLVNGFALANDTNDLPTALANIGDKNLQSCVERLAAKHKWVSPSDATKITCHNTDIARLDGIEQFGNLEKLSLFNNNISSVDLGGLGKLRSLNLARNKLVKLELSALFELEELYLFDNQLKQLTLNNLTRLAKLKANANGMLNFDYTNLPALSKVYLFDNEMEDIDFASLPKLKYMDVRQNPMPDELYERMDKRTGTTILHDGNADDWD